MCGVFIVVNIICIIKMLYHVSLLGVLVALMLFSLSINCEQHISLFIIHEHILTFLLADTCESCLTGYIWKHCLLQTQNIKSMAICNISWHI